MPPRPSPIFVLATFLLIAGSAHGQPLTRASNKMTGGPISADAWNPSVSGDGRYVAFHSGATNIVAGDTNGTLDIFVYDRKTRRTVRVNVAADGTQANDSSEAAAISGDGRYVAFESRASNLVPGDGNGLFDVFVHDRDADQNGVFDEPGGIATTRVSVSSTGAEGDGDSGNPSISADGQLVSFDSTADNLVPGDQNHNSDALVHDRSTGLTERVSQSSSGQEGDSGSYVPRLSASGRWVIFRSFATNLVDDDTNAVPDVFLFDRLLRTTERVSIGASGEQANADCASGTISNDGRFATFVSAADNLVPGDNGTPDVFVRDRALAVTLKVSVSSSGEPGDGASSAGVVSRDGRVVAFSSRAGNLVADDTNFHADVFVHDLTTLTTSRMSVDRYGEQRFEHSQYLVSLSDDGRIVAFESAADLVADDTNGRTDVFVRDRIDVTLNGIPQAPDPVSFTIDHASGETRRLGLVFLSCSPPTEFPLGGGLTVPLTFDVCTLVGLQLSAFLSVPIGPDGSGTTPTLPFPPVAPGIAIRAAAVTLDLATGLFHGVTGPIEFVTL